MCVCVCARACRFVACSSVYMDDRVWVHAVTLPLDGWVEDQERTEDFSKSRGVANRRLSFCVVVDHVTPRDIFDIRHLARREPSFRALCKQTPHRSVLCTSRSLFLRLFSLSPCARVYLFRFKHGKRKKCD